MSFSIDLYILVYASDRESRWHGPAVAFLKEAFTGSEIICFSWLTLTGYLRMATHPSIMARPRRLDEAMENVDLILSRPNVRMLVETDRFWPVYRALAEEVRPRGSAVTDTHLAALLKVHGVDTLYTVDTDFRKFDFLRVKNPLR